MNENEKIKRIRTLKKKLDAPKYVGATGDIVPFAWRHPLLELPSDKASKVYKTLVEGERARSNPSHGETK